MEFERQVKEILAENHIQYDESAYPSENYDDFSLMIVCIGILEALRFVQIISGIAWCKVEEDYDVSYVWLKEGSRFKEENTND